jgi:methane/ammonia monooxygenase subunit B
VGWVNAGDVNRAWPIRKYLPELDLIEGVVGYLFLQDDREHNPASQEQTTAYLRNAIRQFIEATPDDEIGAPALALAKAIQGIVEFDQSKKHDVTPELRKTFEEVVKLVPFSSQARNLKAIVDLKACCTVKSDDHRAQEVISQLMDAVRVEPEDDTSLRNLQNLYLALGSPNAGQVSAVREALKAQEKPISIADAADKPKKSQEAFLRMQALNWYDLKLSKTTGQVNEDYEITGKLHIMNTWPAAIHSDHAFLKVDQSEAVVNRQFTPGSIELKVGKTYEFTMAFRARRPGHWCVSAQLSIANGDQVSSPCKYIDIKDNFADFKDPIDRLNGSTIDLEPFGITSIYMWHLLWFVAGAAWLWYWFTRRGLLGRSMWVASKKEDEVITPQERLVGAITLGGLLLIVIIGYSITTSNYPNTIPLQAGDFGNVNVIAEPASPMQIKYLGGSYKVPSRELVANFRITNNGKEALRVGEFITASQRFVNPNVYTTKVEYPDYLLADRGLSLSDPSPIQPGETRDETITIPDARWDTERLSGLAYDVDSSFVGMLFFFTPNGERYHVDVGGAIVPAFVPG